MKYPRNYHKALKIQDALFADVENPNTTPAARAQLARAWDCLEERKRIIRMKPAPKPIEVTRNGQVKFKPKPVNHEPSES